MQKTDCSYQLYFDELMQEQLLKEEEPCSLYDLSMLHDADIKVSDYTYNTSTWD